MGDKEWPIIRQDLVDKVGQVDSKVSGLEIQQAHNNEKIQNMLERLDGHGNKLSRMEEKINNFIDEFKEFSNGDRDKPGAYARLKRLEELEAGRIAKKEVLLKTAIGSATIATGSAMLWLGKEISEFIKHVITRA